MKTYELTYIISPEITSEEAEAKAKEFESAIKNKEGIILKQSIPAAKTLSYPVKNRPSGFLGVLEFQLEPEKLLELKETISKDASIVRHMIMIKKAEKLRKERRTRAKSALVLEERKTEIKEQPTSTPGKTIADKPEGKGKVELKDIEQELEEILG